MFTTLAGKVYLETPWCLSYLCELYNKEFRFESSSEAHLLSPECVDGMC
jgi:hypothetical protein